MQSSDEQTAVIESTEEQIPEERKHIDGLLDAMEEADAESHREGRHEPGEYDDCPLCKEVR